MATKGSFKTNTIRNTYLVVDWEIQSQSIENNETVVKYSLYVNKSTSGWVYIHNPKLKINDRIIDLKTSRVQAYNNTELKKETVTISHDENGAGRIFVEFERRSI